MVMADGVAIADASDVTAAAVVVGERLVPANDPPIAADAPSAAPVEAVATELMEAEAAAAAASPTEPGANVNWTVALVDPGVMPTVTSVALGYCASIADRIVATSAVVSALVNVISVVTARGVDATAGDADVTCPRLGWLAKIELRSADDTPVMAERAKAAWACAPAGKVRLTPAVDDPGVIVTVAPLAPGKRASIAVCTAAVAAAVSALANVI